MCNLDNKYGSPFGKIKTNSKDSKLEFVSGLGLTKIKRSLNLNVSDKFPFDFLFSFHFGFNEPMANEC